MAETKKPENSGIGPFLDLFKSSSEESESEPQSTVDDALEEHQRVQKKTYRTEVEELERLDEDRKGEILGEIRESTSLNDNEWMSADIDSGTIEVEWEKLKEEDSLYPEGFDTLKSKYEGPAGLFRLTLEPEEDIEFHPGDYISLKLPETPEIDTQGHQVPEAREKTAENETKFNAYSIGSSPNGDQIDLYIKRIPNEEVNETSLTPVLEPKLEENDEVLLKGPESDELELNEVSDRDMVYVATGTGMAPLKSQIEFIFEEDLDEVDGESRDVWMFLGASLKDELPAHEEFKELEQEHKNFHYIATSSREEDISNWEGETEYVQRCLEKYSGLIGEGRGITEDEADLYVCGLSRMAEGVRETLDNMGYDTNSQRYQEEVFD